MKLTPITDACYRRAGMMLATQNDELDKTCRMLETLLGEAREALRAVADMDPYADNGDEKTTARVSLAHIDATLDPDNLEGPPRTRDEMAADARELNRIAPTPAEKFALMFGGIPNPNYVDSPMRVSVTTIDPATGEVSRGVARSEGELRTLLDDERNVDAFRTDPFDDDLDEPLPPKQCGLDDPDCESCQ